MLEMECLQGLFSKTINITMEKLYIELTNRCNLKCAHCYNDSNNGICFDLPFDNITDMLEYAKECKLKSIALSGGEALLYPHISDVFEKWLSDRGSRAWDVSFPPKFYCGKKGERKAG